MTLLERIEALIQQGREHIGDYPTQWVVPNPEGGPPLLWTPRPRRPRRKKCN